jgi:hypothetical protein
VLLDIRNDTNATNTVQILLKGVKRFKVPQ